MLKKCLTSILFAVVLLSLPLSSVLAGTMSWTNNGVTITAVTPNIYHSCTATGDTVTVSGLPAGWTLEGSIFVKFVLQGGGVQIWQTINVDQTSTGAPINVNVPYPPVSQWPLTDPTTNTKEIHIDVQLAVFDGNGVQQMWVGDPYGVIGPGQDWDVFCQAPPEEEAPGTGTPGYWMNHPEAWPVNSITIGGVSYTKAAAIAAMKAPVAGDKTYTMFANLVSAKLNVLVGNESSCIDGTIAAADAWMAANPLGSGVKASSAAWLVGGPLATTLDNYNNGLMCAPHRD